jgi:hypothetical protein
VLVLGAFFFSHCVPAPINSDNLVLVLRTLSVRIFSLLLVDLFELLTLAKLVLMADVHKLRSTVEAIDKNTLDIASRLNSAPPSSLLLDNPTQTSQPEIKSPTPPPAPNLALEPTRTRPALLRKSPPHSNKSLLASPSETPTSSRLSFSFGASARQEPSVPEQCPLPGASFSAEQPISPPPTPASVPENLDGKSVLGSPSPVRAQVKGVCDVNTTSYI